MASKEYIIRILYENPDGSSVGMAPIGSAAANEGSNEAAKKPTPGVSAASALVNSSVNAITTAASQYVDTVTGSGQLARKQNLVNTAMKGAVDLATSAIGGAGIGAALGAATGVGALVAVGLSVVNKLLDIATSMADIQNKVTVEKASIAATKARATISWDRSRER
ncbi:MAG: hypothetical protein IJY71_07085 [Clostridia bacterium]|nr:hypothetical protein [Clostridia bacterium]